MQNIEKHILEIEKIWEEKLYLFCKDIFKLSSLPSHDHDHHKRVWNYAKKLILNLHHSTLIEKDFIEALLLACYFHDTGLTITSSEEHGTHSNSIFIKYVMDNNIKLKLLDDISLAIIKHDDKQHKLQHPNPNSLLTILTTADDLDAFGYIGVIRYIEIYTLRNIPHEDIPELVVENLKNRFNNYLNHYSFLKEFTDNQKERYKTTIQFFEQIIDKSNITTTETYHKILEEFINCNIKDKLLLYIDDNNPFFKSLKQEIDSML